MVRTIIFIIIAVALLAGAFIVSLRYYQKFKPEKFMPVNQVAFWKNPLCYVIAFSVLFDFPIMELFPGTLGIVVASAITMVFALALYFALTKIAFLVYQKQNKSQE